MFTKYVAIRKYAVTVFIAAVSLITSSTAVAGSFQDVWNTTQLGAYSQLPQHPTTTASFFNEGVNLIARAAKRTLSDNRDILPYFQKLVHPIGICFAGNWEIEANSAYTGYFAKDARGLIIVRASEALGQPLAGNYRSFGIAGKIFPTTNMKDATNYKTANFFTIDDLGGADSKSFMDLVKLNEPKTSFHPSSVFLLPMIATIAKAFSIADSNAGIRQVYQISELGLEKFQSANTPHWMMLQAESKSLAKTVPTDFRNELRLSHYANHEIQFGIYVSEKGETEWTRLGKIELNQEALADGCDHRLHFMHPPTK